jgi:hypothetical protein
MEKQLTFGDVCARRHGGNANSSAANRMVCKKQDRETVFGLVELAQNGLTLKEACLFLRRSPNQISGRFTELKEAGRIVVRGRRDGCGVYFVEKESAFQGC